MGSVIGKAGSKIKEIQEASGARLQASEAMLPGSTEVRRRFPSLDCSAFADGSASVVTPDRSNSASCPFRALPTRSTLPFTTSALSSSSTPSRPRTRPTVPAATMAALRPPSGTLPVPPLLARRVATPRCSSCTSRTSSSARSSARAGQGSERCARRPGARSRSTTRTSLRRARRPTSGWSRSRVTRRASRWPSRCCTSGSSGRRRARRRADFETARGEGWMRACSAVRSAVLYPLHCKSPLHLARRLHLGRGHFARPRSSSLWLTPYHAVPGLASCSTFAR